MPDPAGCERLRGDNLRRESLFGIETGPPPGVEEAEIGLRLGASARSQGDLDVAEAAIERREVICTSKKLGSDQRRGPRRLGIEWGGHAGPLEQRASLRSRAQIPFDQRVQKARPARVGGGLSIDRA